MTKGEVKTVVSCAVAIDRLTDKHMQEVQKLQEEIESLHNENFWLQESLRISNRDRAMLLRQLNKEGEFQLDKAEAAHF